MGHKPNKKEISGERKELRPHLKLIKKDELMTPGGVDEDTRYF